jgi:hypothetical protein
VCETYRAIDGRKPCHRTAWKASIGTAGQRSVHRWVAPTWLEHLARFGREPTRTRAPDDDGDEDHRRETLTGEPTAAMGTIVVRPPRGFQRFSAAARRFHPVFAPSPAPPDIWSAPLWGAPNCVAELEAKSPHAGIEKSSQDEPEQRHPSIDEEPSFEIPLGSAYYDQALTFGLEI